MDFKMDMGLKTFVKSMDKEQRNRITVKYKKDYGPGIKDTEKENLP
jgi:hypothetical protein